MSMPEAAAGDDDTYLDNAGDTTQPAAEILSALTAAAATSGDSSMKDDAYDQEHTQPQEPPPSEYDALTAQLAENPHNPDGWRRLVHVAEETRELEKISATYDALLKQYPNNATAQIQYITHYVDRNMSENAEDLFKKFLVRSPCVELWQFYLTYVRRLNPAPAQRETVRMSYEFALNHVGQDKDSGGIWYDYIQFLQAGEAATTWDQSQKMDSLRKVYHRAVQIPLDNVEKLWQELETFETGLNKITAKKFMVDLSPAHMQARTVHRQLVNHLGPLYANSQDLYLPSLPKFDASERALVGKWKAYLKWEESNPLELDEKDKVTLNSRIQSVYRKAVIRMRYYTEIWFMAYTWTNSIGKQEEAFSILKAGLEANPSSFLLNFAYVEALEIKKDYAGVHTTYEKFLRILRTNLDKLGEEAGNISLSTNGSASPEKANTSNMGMPPSTQPANNPNANGNEPASQASSFNSQSTSSSSDDKQPKMTELQKHRTEYGLAWIMYMRFGMRAEGVKACRGIFGKARKDRWTPWEVYEAAALNEYHCSDDKAIPSRIFEKGMETFGDEIEFVLRYLGFLISINDKNNARALFERVIPTFPPERARPLWERWARYEYQYGDLEAALKLEKRMAEVYTSDPPIKRLAQRHIYLGTDAIADRDLGFANARRVTISSTQSLIRTEPSQSFLSSSQQQQQPLTGAASQSYIGGGGGGTKRPLSPDYRSSKQRDSGGSGGDGHNGRQAGEYGMPAHKRARASSPPPRGVGGGGGMGDRDGRDGRDGGRWDGQPSSRRRFSPPPPASWERDDARPPPSMMMMSNRGDRGGGGGQMMPQRGMDRDRDRDRDRERDRGEEDKRFPAVPPLLSLFISELPAPASFDGPVFRTDDLMNLFRTANISTSNASRPKSPLGPPQQRGGGGGRPPPDYGPYQGPNSGGGGGGGGRRRY